MSGLNNHNRRADNQSNFNMPTRQKDIGNSDQKDDPHIMHIDGSAVYLHFNGAESLNSRLASALGAMVNHIDS